MRATNNPVPPSVTRLHRILLAIVVAVFLAFALGALILLIMEPSTRHLGRAAAYLLVGTSAVLVVTFVVAYVTLRVLERRRGRIDAHPDQDR